MHPLSNFNIQSKRYDVIYTATLKKRVYNNFYWDVPPLIIELFKQKYHLEELKLPDKRIRTDGDIMFRATSNYIVKDLLSLSKIKGKQEDFYKYINNLRVKLLLDHRDYFK